MSTPKDYHIGMDLANFQAIKHLAMHVLINEPDLQMYRNAIRNLAADAEKECYKLLEEKQHE